MAKMVKIINNTNTEVGITLNTGKKYVALAPFIKGKQGHISAPVEYTDLPDSLTKKGGMIARGEVSIIDA